MSTTIARLENTGDLKITGEVNNRLPSIKNGLVAYYPFDGTIEPQKSIDIQVYNGNIIDKVGSSIIGISSVTTTEDRINFTGATNSWIKLSNLPFTNTNDFILEVEFTLASFNTISTIFHLASSGGGNACSLIIRPDGSAYSDFENKSSAKLSESGIFILNKKYKVVMSRINNIVSITVNGAPGGYSFTNSNAMIITSAVLGQEQDTDYGNFDATQSLIGSITSFSFRRINTASGSNYTLTNDGIYIEEATTNLWNGMTDINVTSGKWSIIDNTFPYCPFPKPLKISKCEPTSYMNYRYILNTDETNYPSGTTFTFQAWVFVDKDCDCMGPIYIGGESVTTCASQYDKTKKGTWQYLEVTVTSTGAGFKFLLYCNTGTGGNTWTKGNVYFANVQVEKKTFSTQYTETSRGEPSVNILVNNINTTTTPFSLKFILAPNGCANPAWYGLNINNFGKIWLHSPTVTDIYNRRYIWDYIVNDSNRSSRDLISPILFVPGKEEEITITWDLSIVKIYRNGILWDQLAKTNNCTLGIIDKIVMNRNMGKIKNLAMYNKVLTEEEILKLANGRYSILSNGDLIVDDIDEYLTDSLPDDAFYYPLDFESKDITKTYEASEDTNTVYEDGAVWVGTAVTNYSNNGNAESGTLTGFTQPGAGATGTTISIISDDKYSGNYCLKLQRTGNTSQGDMSHYYGVLNTNSLGSVSGKSIICRAKVKANRSGINLKILIARNGGNWQGMNNTIISTGEWQDIYVTSSFDTSDALSCISRIYFGDHNTSGDGDYILIDEWMLTDKAFLVPYTPSSRAGSSLEFNLYSSIGLDWSKDWTIIYWKKPIATADNTFTNFCLESLGCSNNTIGGNYIWWGKDTNSDTIKSSSPSPIVPSEYFNHWRMISLQKSGTTLTIKEWSTQGVTVRSSTVSLLTANAYLTQYGYDLKLGGYNNTNACNCYYKDLVVIKDRCMSDADVEELWKRKMKQKDKTLYLQGQVQETILPL